MRWEFVDFFIPHLRRTTRLANLVYCLTMTRVLRGPNMSAAAPARRCKKTKLWWCIHESTNMAQCAIVCAMSLASRTLGRWNFGACRVTHRGIAATEYISKLLAAAICVGLASTEGAAAQKQLSEFKAPSCNEFKNRLYAY